MIRFNCVCGRELQSPEELAGYSGACPRCGRVRTVPHQSGPGETGDTGGNRRAVLGRLRGLTGRWSLVAEFLTVVAIIGVLVSLLLPPRGCTLREPTPQIQAADNLKQIGLALIDYAEANPTLSPAGGEKALHPGLSWRVAILPYLGASRLYKQFHLDEPWDSTHNKELLTRAPLVFAIPGADDPPGTTRLRAFVGKGTAFEKLRLNVRGPGDARAQDIGGLAKWILVIEAAEAVPWTKPDELAYDPAGPLPQLSKVAGGPRALMGDTSIRTLDPNMPAAELRKLIAP
jgi:hypothetical protein